MDLIPTQQEVTETAWSSVTVIDRLCLSLPSDHVFDSLLASVSSRLPNTYLVTSHAATDGKEPVSWPESKLVAMNWQLSRFDTISSIVPDERWISSTRAQTYFGFSFPLEASFQSIRTTGHIYVNCQGSHPRIRSQRTLQPLPRYRR